MFRIFALLPRVNGTPGFRKAKRLQPFLYFDGFDIREPTSSPAWQDPLLEVALVRHLRGIRFPILLIDLRGWFGFVEDVRQLGLAIVICKRLERDALDELLRSLLVDF